MKRQNIKIYIATLALVYMMIASACFLNRLPLVFSRGYSNSQFFALFILLGLLNLGLILAMDTLEKAIKKYLTSILTTPLSVFAYFILSAFMVLFVFTLIAGFVESGFWPFYYYGCISNSCIYLVSGYTATFVASVYFAYRYVKATMLKRKV